MSKGDAPDNDAPEREEHRVRLSSRALVCRHCGHGITTPEEALSVGGAHTHTFTNPSGMTFHVRCFREARVAPVGHSETFFTWFPGHSWRAVVCEECRAHLGWRFEGASVFHGLIHDRIAEA